MPVSDGVIAARRVCGSTRHDTLPPPGHDFIPSYWPMTGSGFPAVRHTPARWLPRHLSPQMPPPGGGSLRRRNCSQRTQRIDQSNRLAPNAWPRMSGCHLGVGKDLFYIVTDSRSAIQQLGRRCQSVHGQGARHLVRTAQADVPAVYAAVQDARAGSSRRRLPCRLSTLSSWQQPPWAD